MSTPDEEIPAFPIEYLDGKLGTTSESLDNTSIVGSDNTNPEMENTNVKKAVTMLS